MEEIIHNLYSFPVVLPDNPLKWLNCYVIKGGPGERSLLVDTGFRRPECLEALQAGMEELSLRPEETDVFLTHLHSDHTGNAATLQALGCRLFMNEPDLNYLQSTPSPARRNRFIAEGMSPEVLELVLQNTQGRRYASGPFTAETVQEGDLLSYGGYTLECLATPGHTPGHMCLYDRKKQLILLGDHVLFDITPNICYWVEMEDALGTYLESLRKVRDLPVRTALPGHRTLGEVSMRERIDELFAHHTARLNEAEQIVRDNPGISAYELTGKMTWKIRTKSWDEFPPGQKWFAMGEALAHLDHLVLTRRLSREVQGDGRAVYTATVQPEST